MKDPKFQAALIAAANKLFELEGSDKIKGKITSKRIAELETTTAPIFFLEFKVGGFTVRCEDNDNVGYRNDNAFFVTMTTERSSYKFHPWGLLHAITLINSALPKKASTLPDSMTNYFEFSERKLRNYVVTYRNKGGKKYANLRHCGDICEEILAADEDNVILINHKGIMKQMKKLANQRYNLVKK